MSESANKVLSACYSVRLLRGAYTGPVVNVRRSSDNATSAFYADQFQSSGDLWATQQLASGGTSLTSWLGAATAYVVTWYDQSGNGNNASNGTTGATQPNLSYQSGKWVLQWQNANATVLNMTTAISPYTVLSQFLNNNSTGTIASSAIDFGLRLGYNVNGFSNNGDWYYSSGGTKLSYVNGAPATALTLSAWHYMELSTSTPATTSPFTRIGMDGFSSDRSINGYMTEIMFHSSTLTDSDMLQYYWNRIL